MKQDYTFTLTGKGIDDCSAIIDTLPDKYFSNRKQRVLSKLSMEEILINYQHRFGEEKSFTFSVTERFRHLSLSLRVEGEAYNPLFRQNMIDDISDYMLARLTGIFDNTPDYLYKYGINEISITYKTVVKTGMLVKTLIALVLGILLSAAGLFLPDGFRSTVLTILDSMKGIILNLIVMSATLVVFLMMIQSINSCDSISKIKKAGTQLLIGYGVRLLVGIGLMLLCITFMFSFNLNMAGGGADIFSTLLETISGIFPDSYITPFVDGNFLQIIILGALIGFATLIIGDPAEPFLNICYSLSRISNQIMSWFCALIPVFIFMSIPALVWNEQLAMISGVWSYFVMIVSLQLIYFTIFFLLMCVRLKMRPDQAFKIIFPVILKACLTASSSATLPDIKSATESLGVPKSFSDFSSAIGLILCLVEDLIMQLIIVFYLMDCNGMSISPALILSLIITCLLLVLASPPVSGGPVATSAIIIGILGLPSSYLAVAAPLIAILDFFNTGIRCGSIIVQSVSSADALGERNLKSKKKSM